MSARTTPAANTLPPPDRILRVGELTRYLQHVLDDDRLLQNISVMGEVIDLSPAPSGHFYFRLKDGPSVLPCVMWRLQASQQREQLQALRPGLNVIAGGSMSIYDSRGIYQLTVQRLRIQGEGAARLRFDRLRAKLEAEGLFDPGRKRPIPSHPDCLALVTSPDSDAYHDVIKRLRGQWPRVRVVVAGVSVQGEHAPGDIALAIDMANRLTNAGVLLLVRGGGSEEELGWFNDERVARAIFASRIPVITGIGHEKDVTIADLVADLRAPTPTAAAAAAVPDGFALRRECRQLQAQLQSHMRRGIQGRRQRVAASQRALVRASPVVRVRLRRQRVDELWARLVRATDTGVALRRRRLDAVRRQLQALDPQSILSRGYALVTDATTGAVISTVEAATTGRLVRARVKDGQFTARVIEGA